MKKLLIFFTIFIFIIILIFMFNLFFVTVKRPNDKINNFNMLSERDSYDKKYTMLVMLDEYKGMEFIKVIIKEKVSQKEVFSITKEYRAFDFNWITWEDNSYNFWLKSSDLGINCYKYLRNDLWDKYSLRKRNEKLYLYKEGYELEIEKEDINKKLPDGYKI